MGFEKEILREGDGRMPTKGKPVTVHCTGYGKNGDMNLKVIENYSKIICNDLLVLEHERSWSAAVYV